MSTSSHTRSAAVAYQDARECEQVGSWVHLLELADALADDALDLVRDYDDMQDAIESSYDEGSDTTMLTALIRDEHDRGHLDPWPICDHHTCREAARLGQR